MRAMLIVTAVCVTMFPVLYAVFSPWYRSRVGTALLFKSISTALLIDYSAARIYLFPDASARVNLTIYLVLLITICATSLFFTTTLLHLNFFSKENKNERRRNAGQAPFPE
jgi:hypothetical protein